MQFMASLTFAKCRRVEPSVWIVQSHYACVGAASSLATLLLREEDMASRKSFREDGIVSCVAGGQTLQGQCAIVCK